MGGCVADLIATCDTFRAENWRGFQNCGDSSECFRLSIFGCEKAQCPPAVDRLVEVNPNYNPKV